MIKRLKEESGTLAEGEEEVGGELVKEAIIVHAGEFQSMDGPITFDEARLKQVVANQNAYYDQLAKDYKGKVPAGAYPPVLDSHDDKSNNDVIGRSQTKFEYAVRDIPKVGKNIPCIITKLNFKGEKNIEAVKDGRIFHLSIGIDEERDIVDEISTVIDPAAPGASLLSKGKKKKSLVKSKNLSDNTKKGELSMAKKKVKKLTSNKERQMRLAALVAETSTVLTKAKEVKKTTDLARAEHGVRTRLSTLVASKKLTPAEFKSYDVKKLAALSKDAQDVLFDSMAKRQDVIEAGQRGAKEATNASSVFKGLEKAQHKKLKNEIRADIARLSGKKLKKLAAEDGEFGKETSKEMAEKEAAEDGEKSLGSGEVAEHMAKMAAHVDAAEKAMEAGDMDKAKEHMAHCKKMAGMEPGAEKEMAAAENVDAEKSMAAMQEQVDQLSVQLAKVTDEMSKMLKEEESEGADLEKEMAADEDEAAKKKEMAGKKAAAEDEDEQE